MAPKIVFSNTRNGSTRFTSLIKNHNFKYFDIGSVPGVEFLVQFDENDSSSEFWLNDHVVKIDKHEKSFHYMLAKTYFTNIQVRINFLETCREQGIDFTLKLKPQFIYDYNLVDWMLEFYKDWEIIRVCRRDNFRAGLSYIYQVENNFKTPQNTIKENFKNTTKPFEYRHKKKLFRYWKLNKKIENEKFGTLIYNEDWTDEELCEWLKIPTSTIHVKPIELDYEKIITNVDEIREWYDEFLQS